MLSASKPSASAKAAVQRKGLSRRIRWRRRHLPHPGACSLALLSWRVLRPARWSPTRGRHDLGAGPEIAAVYRPADNPRGSKNRLVLPGRRLCRALTQGCRSMGGRCRHQQERYDMTEYPAGRQSNSATPPAPPAAMSRAQCRDQWAWPRSSGREPNAGQGPALKSIASSAREVAIRPTLEDRAVISPGP
jgi:hypothetical protein